ncbi:MAG: family 20 glycosylhydrolase, partial [Stenotrophomonas sp.]
MTGHRLSTHALHAALLLALAATSGQALAATNTAPAASQLPVEVTGASIIPRPVSVLPGNGRFSVDASTRVIAADGASEVATQFTQLLARTTPLRLTPSSSGQAKGAIQFRINKPASNAASPEGYTLRINNDGVLVEAGDARGLFYGAMSLWQLLAGAPANSISLAAMQVEDAPRFSWRGFMLDSARHFQSIDDIKLILDAMATHKLNTFHWHLTDDQGWRMEIKRYPKLTEVGSCRSAAGEAGVGADGKPHLYCGFYTQDQIRDVVAYAAARHITVVPEIDVPGHAQAAVAAYPEHGVVDGPTKPSANWGVNPYLF